MIDETHIDSRFHLAMLLHKTYDLGEARRHFTEVAKQRPDDETVLHQLALVCYDQQAWNYCIDYLTKALEMKGRYVDALFTLGMARLMNK
jgi:tetratricopeptide (TPR) repeat protein